MMKRDTSRLTMRLPKFAAVTFLLLPMVITVCTGIARAQEKKRPVDLTELSLDELMRIEVTSVSKREQKLIEAPAAVHVITQEDIRRSGATSIPELLRMVPGMEVARIGANWWAITARGFNSEFANKLLVLIDGRSVYSPLFAGVFWDVQELILEDIERIEVIRGPGASLWGANAVNGVINIITKNARATQGGLITAGGGNLEGGFGSLRYGAKLGTGAYYRLHAKYFKHSSYVDDSGKDAGDEWHVLRGGGRLDWQISKSDGLTVQGDVYDGAAGRQLGRTLPAPPFTELFHADNPVNGGNVITRWDHLFSGGSTTSLKFYYDRTERNFALLDEKLDTFDLDFQHVFSMGRRQEIVWGLGWRNVRDDTKGSFSVTLNPPQRTDNLFSAFVQDEVTAVRERLRITVGSKFEHNSYTGFEVQPTVRLAWTPTGKNTFWGAVSRAVRIPSRVEDDIRVNALVFPGPGGLLTYAAVIGNRATESEKLTAYEIGYRHHLAERFFFSIAAFHNVYNNLVAFKQDTPFIESVPQPTHLVIPLRGGNGGGVRTTGVEVAGDWSVARRWKLAAGYTWFNLALGGFDPGLQTDPGNNPRNQFQVHSFLNLGKNVECDAALYYVARLPSQEVDSYVRADIRLGWRPRESLDMSLALRNLIDDTHAEFGGQLFGFAASRTQVPRDIVGKLMWRF